ncbi:MAG: hypothetical protein ACYDA0_15390 [Candidatus Dormibacteraceae bacterium]
MALQPTTGSNTMATVGGILGIVGWVLAWIPFVGIFFGLLLGLLAVIFSSIGLSRAQFVNNGKGMAIAGLVLGILAVVWKLIPGLNLI